MWGLGWVCGGVLVCVGEEGEGRGEEGGGAGGQAFLHFWVEGFFLRFLRFLRFVFVFVLFFVFFWEGGEGGLFSFFFRILFGVYVFFDLFREVFFLEVFYYVFL